MNNNYPKLAEEWFNSGDSDYRYAEIGLKENYIYPQIAFLSQQTAEKYLKGFLVFHGIEPPRIHDLPKLLNLCIKIELKLSILKETCNSLTGYYIESRYPPSINDYSKEELETAVENARQVKEMVESLI